MLDEIPEIPEKPERAQPPRGKVWRTSQEARQSSKTTGLIVGLFLVVVLVGALFGMIMLLKAPVAPYFESVPIVKYNDADLPPNPWSEADGKFLCDAFPDGSTNFALTTQERQKILDLLSQRREGSPGGVERPYILHIVGLGAATENDVYLIPADASATERNRWIKIDDVLTAMRDSKARRKLLILDIARSTANPILGPLSDDVATRLDAILEDPKRPPLPCPVLTSCSPGEVSHMIPNLRVSAFAFYFGEGLRGGANGYGPSGNHMSEKITVRELAGYLAVRTARWAKSVLEMTQRPKLYTRGLSEPEIDFAVVLTTKPGEEKEPKPLNPVANLLLNWKDRDDQSHEARRYHAAAWNRWESVLLRVERGNASLGESDLPLNRGDRFQEATRRPVPRSVGQRRLPPLPAVEAGKPDPLKNIRETYRKLVQAADRDLLSEPGKAAFEKAKADFQLAALENPPLAARIVWDWAINENATGLPPRMLQLAMISLETCLRDKISDYGESVAIQTLARSTGGALDSPEALQARKLALAAVEERAAILDLGPTGFSWVRSRAEAGEQRRLQAWQSLLEAKDTAQVRTAMELHKDLTDQLQNVKKRLRIAAEARQVANEALRVVTATAFSAAEYDYPPVEPTWKDLARSARSLVEHTSVTPATAEEWVPEDLEPLVSTVRQKSATVQAFSSAGRVKDLVERAKANTLTPADLQQMRATLACPLISATERKDLWGAMDATTLRLHKMVREEIDLPESESGRPGKPPAVGQLSPPSASRRGEVSLTLLQLAGLPGVAELEKAARDGPDRLGPLLRKAWREDYVTAAANLTRASDWPRLDRLSRVFPVGLWPLDSKSGADDSAGWRDAAEKCWSQDESAFHAWLQLSERKSNAPVRNGASGQ